MMLNLKIAKRSLAAIALVSVLVVLSACQTASPPQNLQANRLTPGAVKTFIVKGVTTEADINGYFGAPNLVTQNSSGLDVWSYNRMSSTSSSSGSYGSLLLVGGSSSNASVNTQSFDLIITFNAKEVVQDYKMIASSY